MSGRRTAALAAILVALAAYFFAFENVAVEVPEPDWKSAEKIIDCGEDGVESLVVAAAGGVRLEARRDGVRWVIEPAPSVVRQAEVAVGDLVTALCTLPVIETIPDPESPSAFGLDQPSVEVRLQTGGGERMLRVGALTPARNFLYVARDGERAVLKVGALVRSEVDKVLLHAREKPRADGSTHTPFRLVAGVGPVRAGNKRTMRKPGKQEPDGVQEFSLPGSWLPDNRFPDRWPRSAEDQDFSGAEARVDRRLFSDRG